MVIYINSNLFLLIVTSYSWLWVCMQIGKLCESLRINIFFKRMLNFLRLWKVYSQILNRFSFINRSNTREYFQSLSIFQLLFTGIQSIGKMCSTFSMSVNENVLMKACNTNRVFIIFFSDGWYKLLW